MRSVRNTRKYPRLPIAFPVFVHARGQDGQQFLEFATVLNVSAGGVLVVLRKIPPTKHVSMEIPLTPGLLPEGAEAVRFLKARIVRTEPRDQHLLVGMQFDHPLVGHA